MPYLTKTTEIYSVITKFSFAKTLWLDTETASWHTPNPRVSLIQVLTDTTDLIETHAYILDVLGKPNLVTYFVNQIMINPEIEKVFHNASYDLKFLGREQAQNVTCTLKMAKLSKKMSAQLLQLPNLKLKTLAEELCHFTNVDKEEQGSDWGRRPLTEKQLQYAKMDTVYLAHVHRRLLEINKPTTVNKIIDMAVNGSKPQTQKSKDTSFSVTKVRVAFECPRLFYLGHRFGGMTIFSPIGNSSGIGNAFHELSDQFVALAKQEPQFRALFEPVPEHLKVEAIAPEMQRLFYDLAFFPYLQEKIKTDSGKAPAFLQLWEGLKGLIQRWAELLVKNRYYCSAEEVINKTLLDLKPGVKHNFQLPDGTHQLVQGRFDSIIYDFEHQRLCVVEYKTYQSPDKSAQLAQVALYSYMLREKIGVPINSAVYSVLPDWQELTFSWDELEKTVHQLIPQKLLQMQQWITWEPPQPNPPPPTTQPELLCDICPQRKKCQTFFEVTAEASAPTSAETLPTRETAAPRQLQSQPEPLQPQPKPQQSNKVPTPDADAIAQQLVATLRSFKINVDYLGAAVGPAFIRVKLKPHLGVSVTSLLKKSADLQVQLGIANPPLIAPQPGFVSVDLPRPERQVARFEDYIQPQTTPSDAPVRIAIGVDLDGQLVEADLSDPNSCHFLVGGRQVVGRVSFCDRSCSASFGVIPPNS